MNAKILFLTAILLSCAGISLAQQQSSVTMGAKGVSVFFKTESSDLAMGAAPGGGVIFDDEEVNGETVVHRVITDRSSGSYFGYDVAVQVLDGGKFKVSIRPLTINAAEKFGLKDLAAVALPKYPSDMVVEEGDRISLEVLSNAKTKAKIFDIISIRPAKKGEFNNTWTNSTSAGFGGSGGSGNGGSGASVGNGAGFGGGSGNGTGNGAGTGSGAGFGGTWSTGGQNFTPDAVNLTFNSPKLWVSGSGGNVEGGAWDGVVQGSLPFVYVPGKGRFVFSLSPRGDNWVKSNAVVDGNKVIFQTGGETYEVICSSPIMSEGGKWNLWMATDPNYKPDNAFTVTTGKNSEAVQFGVTTQVDATTAKKPKVATQRDLTAIYQNWVQQDVAYIITPEEKISFLRLQSDEERESFIDNFWKRRDPNPKTEQNEFRIEYYSRIAAANEKYTTPDKKGWQTDRGRILIQNGQPDQINADGDHEIWVYNRAAQGIVKFDFVNNGQGGFKLVQ